MRLSRYIVLLMAMLIGIAARGQDFNPTSPAEPNQTFQVKLLVNPAEAGTVSGGGWYTAKAGNVRLSATSSSTDWKFVNWTDKDGNEVSTSASFTHTMSNAHVVYTANFEKAQTMQLTIQSNPAGIFTSKVNQYRIGESVSVSTSTYTNYTFVNWTDKAGNEVSTARSFSYTTKGEDEVLTANFRFTPSSPSEPLQTRTKHKVFFTANPSGAGYFNQTSGMQVSEGYSYSVTASNYSNYSFRNWTIDGVEVSTNRTYSAVMGTEDVTLVANYYFNPGNPSEPSADKRSHFSLYANTLFIYKNQSVLYPVYLENTSTVTGLDFSMIIPEGFVVDTESVQTTSRTSAYTATASMDGNVLSVVMSGGTLISDNNGPVVLIPLKATESLEDGEYELNFGSAMLDTSAGTKPTVTFRNGIVRVETLEEGEIVAQYSYDRYMNRVQFTNTSSSDSRSYVWDFGDGQTSTEVSPMHIYSTPGTYTVRLTAKGIVKENVAEQSIIINAPTSWVAEGDYTVGGAAGVRNFVSMNEAVCLLSQCSPRGQIVVRLASGQNQYALDVTNAESLGYLSTLADALKAGGYQITFTTDDAKTKNIAFTARETTDDLQVVMNFLSQLALENVTTSVNGVSIDISPLLSVEDETVCAESSTSPVMLADISSDARFSVEWLAVVAENSTLADYQLSGRGNLPSMQITCNGTTNQTINYQITMKLGDVVLATTNHRITVRPLISRQTLTYNSPADGAEVNFGSQTLSWTNLNSLATEGYTLTIQRTDISSPEQNISLKTYSYSFYCQAGASYKWHVTAHGVCDDLTGAERTFTVKKKADLAVTSITAPNSTGALKKLTITATVKNQGEGTTLRSSWTDAIYYSTSATDFSSATRLGTVSHSGALAPGESYTIKYETTAPDASLGVIYYYVVADYNNSEDEANEDNNKVCSDAVVISESFMDEGDYTALKTLYHALNGAVWNKEWRINSNAINSTAWPGVTFSEEGRVTAISLQDNNMIGTVPEDFDLPYLTSLNLSRNNIKGNLSKFLSKCESLTTVNLGYCNFEDITTALPASIKTLNLQYQNEDKSISRYTPQVWETRNAGIDNVTLTSLMSYDLTSRSFAAHPQLNIYSESGSYMGNIKYSGKWMLSLNGDYTLSQDAILVVRPSEGCAAYTKMTALLNWIQGDANVDGVVDVRDAQHILNRVLARQSGNFNFAASDNYGNDGILNVQDIVATINLFIEDETANAKARTAMVADADDADCSIYTTGGGLYLDASQPVAALDVVLSGVKASQVSLQLSNVRFQMHTKQTADGVRIVIISPTGDEIPTGVTRVLKISKSGAEPISVKAADVNAADVKVRITDSGIVDAIESVSTADDAADTIYDLLGRRVETATRGIYIINGKKIKK